MIESGNFNNRESLKNILLENGYPVKDGNGYINTAALFRGGTDPTSIAIYDNKAIDFVTSTKYKLEEFIKLITNQSSDSELEKYLQKNNIIIQEPIIKIKTQTIFPNEILSKLLPLHLYWTNRGIDENILKELKGGIYGENRGIFKSKYVFPIINSKNQIIGLSGRDITNKSVLKWIHRGQRNSWVWPAFYNHNEIVKKNSVILVESPGDALSLLSCGIKNVLVLFGTDLNLSILNYLLKLNIEKIYVSTNDDSNKQNNMAGNNAALKIQKKLNKYFNKTQIDIIFPSGGNDWNEILMKNGKQEIIKQLNKIL